MQEILKSLALKMIGKVSGPVGWIIGLILDRVIGSVVRAVQLWLEKKKQEREDAEALKKYKESVAQGEAGSREERRRRAEDLLSGK